MYAIIENNVVIEYPVVNLSQRFPNISFPVVIDNTKLPENIVWVVSATVPTYDPKLQKLQLSSQPVLLQGIWQQQYTVVPLSAEELQAAYALIAQQVRDERTQQLMATDWTQVLDAPVDRTLWSQYRQQLRDVTSQPGFPYEILWPIKPE